MIIIPSTSIYAKDNPKIIKNNYSGVSATVSTARRTQASDTNVLSVDEVVDNAYMTTYPINFSSLHSEISINVQPKNRKAIALYTMSLNSKEYKKTFYIEKKSGDKDIISIDSSTFTGSVYGRKEIYECDASFDLIRNGAEGSSSVLYEISGEVVFNEGSLLKTEYDVLIHSINEDTKISITQPIKDFAEKKYITRNLYSVISFYNSDKIQIEFKENQNNYEIQITVLVGMDYYYVAGESKDVIFTDNTYKPYIYPFNHIRGESIKYIPETIQFSLNGESYELKLSESKLIVGEENNSNVFAIQETNELMQKTPQLQDNIRQIYNQYKDTGKEVATIKCSIVDYLDEQGNKIVSPNIVNNLYDLLLINEVEYIDIYEENFYRWTGGGQDGIFTLDLDRTNIFALKREDNIYTLQFTKGQDNEMLFQIWHGYFGGAIEGSILFDTTELTYGNTYTFSFEYGYSEDSGEAYIRNMMLNIGGYKPYEKPNFPMTIPMHSEVIPYVFKANGEDAPMSTYQDGSPKVFQVVGNRITYDGAVWQELTLQEVRQNEN